MCLKEITDHAFHRSSPELSDRCIVLLKAFRNQMSCGAPRVISKAASTCWYLFTDACYEPSDDLWKCGLGGIIVDELGQPCRFFSIKLTDKQISLLGGDVKKTIIFEAEMVALILGLKLWSSFVSHALAVCFVDNNSARDIAISASGRSKFALALVDVLLRSESELGFYPWFARVPSPSNPADKPSRNSFKHLLDLGVSRDENPSCLNDLVLEVCKVESELSSQKGG